MLTEVPVPIIRVSEGLCTVCGEPSKYWEWGYMLGCEHARKPELEPGGQNVLFRWKEPQP